MYRMQLIMVRFCVAIEFEKALFQKLALTSFEMIGDVTHSILHTELFRNNHDCYSAAAFV